MVPIIILIVHCVRAATLLRNRIGDRWRTGLATIEWAVSSLDGRGIDTRLAFNMKRGTLVRRRRNNRLPTKGIEPSRLRDALCNTLPSSGLVLVLVLFLFLRHKHSILTKLLSPCFLVLRFISRNPYV